MQQMISKPIQTENGNVEFQVRLLKEEGVGLLTTREDRHYLILDSIDYWYDLIQDEYPKKKKCACKNEWFKVQFDYIPREGTEDIREVRIITTCVTCQKVSTAASIDIDYSPTDELLSRPITFCEQPNIKYKYTEFTSYWSHQDLKTFLQAMFKDLQLNVYCWFFEYPAGKRKFEKVSAEKAMQIVTVNHQYLDFYFSAQELDLAPYIEGENKEGVYVKDGLWRKSEVIHLSSPFVITGLGVYYYIKYCNQYLDKGLVADKSKEFEAITNRLQAWLKEHFISKRGKKCFDGEEAYNKLMAKK